MVPTLMGRIFIISTVTHQLKIKYDIESRKFFNHTLFNIIEGYLTYIDGLTMKEYPAGDVYPTSLLVSENGSEVLMACAPNQFMTMSNPFLTRASYIEGSVFKVDKLENQDDWTVLLTHNGPYKGGLAGEFYDITPDSIYDDLLLVMCTDTEPDNESLVKGYVYNESSKEARPFFVDLRKCDCRPLLVTLFLQTHGLIPRAVEQLNNKDIIILTRGERLFESRMSMLHMNIESLRGAILDNRIATTQKIMATLSINLVAR
ncbi:hypothetical protein FOL47_006544 [Perkinsus chesapeaki]|uniref:Uncharacterized protein n=1 Tax=Perkinsus chesapeaki TaxID=330153 RepID=A0A7J6LS06_PERCH|nr:hypothetical protein FOL47_006544 [Perkinsus chesapeaki]